MPDRSLLFSKALQFSAHRLTNELRAAIRSGNGVYFFQRLDREADKDRLNPHRRTTHENNLPESDIAY